MTHHNRVNEVYYGEIGDEVTQDKVRERIHWICENVQGHNILDIGCGQGIKSLLLGREGFQVLGVDTEAAVIAYANRQLAEEEAYVRQNVSFRQQEVMSNPLGRAAFDTVIMDGVIEHLVQPQRFLKEMWNILKDGGHILLTTPLGIHDNPETKRTYYLATLLNETEICFELKHIDIIGDWLCFIGSKREEQLSRISAKVDLALVEQVENAFYQTERALHAQLKEKENTLNRQAEEAQTIEEDLVKRLEAKEARNSEYEVRIIELQHECKLIRAEVAQLKTEKEKLLKELKTIKQSVQLYSKRASEIVSHKDKNIHYLRGRLAVTEQSTKYRLGSALVNTAKNPLTLPKNAYLIARMFAGKVRRKLTRFQRKYKLPQLPYDDSPLPRLSDVIGLKTAGERYALAGDGKLNELLLAGLHDPVSLKELRVAAILDEFSAACFAPDCQLVTFRPDNWREMLMTDFPHLLFVESAWKGNGGSWQYKIAKYNLRQGNELDQLLLWCKHHNVPTVFWNKEDPVHFEKFIQTAKKFDIIFTSDANCIKKYQEAAGHERVYALPFAAQPLIHNPVRVMGYKQKEVCFAGSYYANRHPQRREDMEYLLDSARNKGLEIYDRNYDSDAPDFQFPERFHPLIKGSLPYEKLLHAYKQYKVFLNTNSVTDSPTMFSRRVFELLACGTTVVSNYAKGIAEIFGDHVLLVDRNNAEASIDKALTDSEWRRKNEIAGLRVVLDQHTYSHRLYEIATKCGYGLDKPYDYSVALVGHPVTQKEAESILAMFRHQSYTHSHLYLFVQKEIDVPTGDERVTVKADDENAVDFIEDYVGVLSPHHYYGEHYVEDLVHAFKYSQADIVGKAGVFAFDETKGDIELRDSEMEYVYTPDVIPAAALFRTAWLTGMNVLFPEVLSEFNLHQVSQFGARIYASDRYNFIKNFSFDRVQQFEQLVKKVTV